MSTPEGGVPGTAGGMTAILPLLTNHDRRHAVADRDGWMCAYCDVGLICHCQVTITGSDGSKAEPVGYKWAELDHVDPSHGRGRNRLENLVLACTNCNSKKGARHVSVMDR